MSRRLRLAVLTVVASVAAAMAAVLLFGACIRLTELLEMPPLVGLVAAVSAATVPVLVLAIRVGGAAEQTSRLKSSTQPVQRRGPATDRVPDWVGEARQRIWNSLPTETRPLDPPPHEE